MSRSGTAPGDRPRAPPVSTDAWFARSHRRLRDPWRNSHAESRATSGNRTARSTRGERFAVRDLLLRSLEELQMPEAKTIRRARKARRQGKSPSTAAGEFV